MKRRSTTEAREAWRLEQSECFVPGCKARYGLECHECLGGSDRSKTIKNHAFLLMLCQDHHRELCSRPNQESLVKQLAWKLWSDPENADTGAVVRMWRPKCSAAFVQEIIEEVETAYATILKEYGP